MLEYRETLALNTHRGSIMIARSGVCSVLIFKAEPSPTCGNVCVECLIGKQKLSRLFLVITGGGRQRTEYFAPVRLFWYQDTSGSTVQIQVLICDT